MFTPLSFLSIIWGQDRVENSPEQVAAASALADRLTQQTGVNTRVVGWYHSHPHITVLPSHVDLNTQVGHALQQGLAGLKVQAAGLFDHGLSQPRA